MPKHFVSLVCLFFCLLAFSCGKPSLRHHEKLAEKCGPADHFALQRSYPDRAFDGQGWARHLHRLRDSETAQARGSSDCTPHLPLWTQQGPMNVAGRCNTLALKPDDENTLLAGFSGGGIFKSTDGAVNWKSVFDEHPELCIGDITFSTSNPMLVFAGTGDPNIPSSAFNGDGIFKSTDAGESWQHLPNSPKGIVSKILIHPTDPLLLWAAVMGNPYQRDNQRGVYKSTDGGNSWTQVLFVSSQAGASDLVQSPANPQILYASFWDRIRNNTESVIYGPNARVYKSTDGGNTWAPLGGGLPTTVMGRTGLAISQTNPDKVYAVYIDTFSNTGGVYKTVNGGSTWTALPVTQLASACGAFGWYFGKIRLDPANDEELYFLAVQLWRKAAGSNTWLNAASGHADSHDLVFAPGGRRYWANDGGVYRNNPGSNTWEKSKNLPTTQFYRSNFNPHFPNQFWAGAQDNGIQKGSGQNLNGWIPVYSGDGFACAFDPADSNHFWVENQNGNISETHDGGDTWDYGSQALGTSDRTNWETPYFLSKHTPGRLYAGTYRAYAKTGSGGWGAISPDLTDGNIFGDRFHNISCINESPLVADKLVVGSSDGNVWWRSAAGAWTNVSAGLPERYVTAVHFSPTQANRIFVSHSGYRDNDDTPHIHRSDNNGASWQAISANLPSIPVNDLYVLPGHNDQVIFAATDAGVYYTLDAGAGWNRLGGNMPYIPVFDLEANPVRKELVAATYARGVWTFPFDSAFVQQNVATANLGGIIQTAPGEGVEEVEVETDLTDSSGVFFLPNVTACAPLTLAPYRNDNPLNGVTTYDLVLISKHILAIEPLGSPLKMIAADANRSGSITTFDIVLLRKLILGLETSVPGNTSWRFVPKSHHFDNPLNPFQPPFPETLSVQPQGNPLLDLDFWAIKTGDLNDSAVPNLRAAADERSVGDCPFDLDVERGESGEIWVRFARSTALQGNLAALQFTLRFDPEQLVFEHLEPLAPGISAENFGLNRLEQGLLSFATEQADALRGNPVFALRFRATSPGAALPQLHIRDWPTPALAYRADGSALRPILRQPALQKTDAGLRCWPSPFGARGAWAHFADIGRAPQTLFVYDVRGQQLFTKIMIPGVDVPMEAGLFPAPGVYFWRFGAQAGKLIFAP